MPSSLDPRFFPHILENTLQHVDRRTLLAARLVSTGMCDIADLLLSGKRLIVLTSAHASKRLSVRIQAPTMDFYPLDRFVPCFHPAGSREAQHRAMGRAKHIAIICDLPSEHLNDLISHVQPTCSITFLPSKNHDVFSKTDFRIPPCSSLSLDILRDCSCQMKGHLSNASPAPAGALCHTAARVVLHLPWRGNLRSITSTAPRMPRTPAKCPLAVGVVNPSVTQLIVVGDLSALPWYFVDIDFQTHPNLQITLEDLRGGGMLKAGASNLLRRRTAMCFKIPEQQVQYVVTDWWNKTQP